MIALTLERMTNKDVDEFLSLEQRVSVPKIYNPIVTLDEALEEIRDNELFFIKKGSVIVGTIAYQTKPDGSTYISNMSVVPEYRGQGIARTAMETIFNIIGSVPRIWLVTHPENVKALNLYTSLGFVVEEQIENYYGDGEPRLVLAKLNSKNMMSRNPHLVLSLALRSAMEYFPILCDLTEKLEPRTGFVEHSDEEDKYLTTIRRAVWSALIVDIYKMFEKETNRNKPITFMTADFIRGNPEYLSEVERLRETPIVKEILATRNGWTAHIDPKAGLIAARNICDSNLKEVLGTLDEILKKVGLERNKR